MKKILVLNLCIVFLMPCFSAGHEKTKCIKGVRGEYAITTDSNISPKEAKEKARECAKLNALAEAFGQHVSISKKLELCRGGESFNSISVFENNGELVNFEVIEEGYNPHPNRYAEMVFYCVANVIVKKGESPDPSFIATINGIRASYIDGETCEFTIIPTKESYLKIFCYENAETGYYLYPGGIHHGLALKADVPTKIPESNNYDIQFFTDKPIETNTIVILLTKEEYPFNISNPTRQDIEKYIVQIPYDKKYVSYHIIDILKR